MQDLTDRPRVTTNRDVAAALLETGASSTETRALAFAQLATADAIDRLTDLLAGMRFPTLDLHRNGGSKWDPQFRVEPVTR